MADRRGGRGRDAGARLALPGALGAVGVAARRARRRAAGRPWCARSRPCSPPQHPGDAGRDVGRFSEPSRPVLAARHVAFGGLDELPTVLDQLPQVSLDSGVTKHRRVHRRTQQARHRGFGGEGHGRQEVPSQALGQARREVGLSTTFQVLILQQDLIEARSAERAARAAYAKALAQLGFAEGSLELDPPLTPGEMGESSEPPGE